MKGRGMSAVLKRLGIQKFVDSPCPTCGTPHSIINGAWLVLEREMAGLTQREMARRVGHAEAYLCDIEKGRRNCTPKIRAAYEALRLPSTLEAPHE